MEIDYAIMLFSSIFAFANIVMIGVEYLWKYFGKPVEHYKVKKHHNTATVALCATVLVGASAYVIPSQLHLLSMICRCTGYAVFVASFIMNFFYMEF